MDFKKIGSLLGAGNVLSLTGTLTQTNAQLETISLVLTCVGMAITILVTLITVVIPKIKKWWVKASKDGKITPDEIKEGVAIVEEAIETVKETVKKKGE